MVTARLRVNGEVVKWRYGGHFTIEEVRERLLERHFNNDKLDIVNTCKVVKKKIRVYRSVVFRNDVAILSVQEGF